MQNDLDALVSWAKTWRMEFNIDKCCVLHLGINNKHHDYTMLNKDSIRIPLKKTTCERDLGVLVDDKLKFSLHCNAQVNKANRMLGLIRRTVINLNPVIFKRLFIALVRPHLEYCGIISHPRLICDKKAYENVLRRSCKLIPGLKTLTYDQRLRELQIPSMQFRFIRGDLIEVYKWFNVYKCQPKLFDSTNRTITRGHHFKLKKEYCRLDIRKDFFTMRDIDKWNSLPNSTVCAKTLN